MFGRPDQLDTQLPKNASTSQIHGRVQARLAAERGQQRIGAFDFENFLNVLPSDRFDVSPVGHIRVGHDRCRIGVHQNDFITFFAKRLAGLSTGIVEFTRLTDHDWTGTDDENFLEIVATWHRILQLGWRIGRLRRRARNQRIT